MTLKYRITAKGIVPVDAFKPLDGDGNNNYKDIAQTDSKKRRPCSSPGGRIEKMRRTLDSVATKNQIENRFSKATRSILDPNTGTVSKINTRSLPHITSTKVFMYVCDVLGFIWAGQGSKVNKE